jgi:hypothetical protein
MKNTIGQLFANALSHRDSREDNYIKGMTPTELALKLNRINDLNSYNYDADLIERHTEGHAHEFGGCCVKRK